MDCKFEGGGSAAVDHSKWDPPYPNPSAQILEYLANDVPRKAAAQKIIMRLLLSPTRVGLTSKLLPAAPAELARTSQEFIIVAKHMFDRPFDGRPRDTLPTEISPYPIRTVSSCMKTPFRIRKGE